MQSAVSLVPENPTVFVTVKASPKYHQMTLDELVYGLRSTPTVCLNENNTKTYELPTVSEHFLRGISVGTMIRRLEAFNASTDFLREIPRRDLYYSFCIPKKSGGLRHIDAPREDLMNALRELKGLLEQGFCEQLPGSTFQLRCYHTSAFAYIQHRSTIDAVKRHQLNESKWFGKLDFHNFFGTTTLDFSMSMLSRIFPYSEICRSEHGREELRKAVELGFLDGVLPQGTPLSPTLTNIIMIPVDHRLSNTLRDFDGIHYTYTRYADDMIISSRVSFNIQKIEELVLRVLREFGAPFVLNQEKTRYGSSAGSNWNLGVMLNRDNQITVGYKNKKRFQAMLSSYAMDRRHGIRWSPDDIMNALGLYSYYRMVERETIDRIMLYLNQKFGLDIIKTMKRDLQPAG